MKIWEAIAHVLENAHEPLRPIGIYEKILMLDLYTFKAQNPIQVVANQLRRHCINIEFPSASKNKYFVRLSDGKYALSNYEDTVSDDLRLLEKETDNSLYVRQLDLAYSSYRSSFKKLLLEELKNLTFEQFEIFSKNFIKRFGFTDVHVTRKIKDGGIDGYGTLNIGISQLHVAFQCKKWRGKNIGIKLVNEFIGSISGLQESDLFYDQGFFFTTSQFTNDAKTAAKGKGAVPVVLVDGMSLVEFMLEKSIGVETRYIAKYLVSLDEFINDED